MTDFVSTLRQRWYGTAGRLFRWGAPVTSLDARARAMEANIAELRQTVADLTSELAQNRQLLTEAQKALDERLQNISHTLVHDIPERIQASESQLTQPQLQFRHYEATQFPMFPLHAAELTELRALFQESRERIHQLELRLGHYEATQFPQLPTLTAAVERLQKTCAALAPQRPINVAINVEAVPCISDADRALEGARLEWAERFTEAGLPVGSDQRVLDLYCGPGVRAGALGDRVESYLGLDPSPTLVAYARSRHASNHYLFRTLQESPLEQLADGDFDLIVYNAEQGRWCEADWSRTIRQIARLLRPRGSCLHVLPWSSAAWAESDRQPLESFAAAGLAVERTLSGGGYVLRKESAR